VQHVFDSVDTLCINTIRTLSMDAVEQARSGHPGAPMGLAPVAHVLFSRLLKHSPAWPEWPDRDRFVLSCGHASMLLYSTLHLAGYPLSLEDIKSFRQWGSITPGHPERGVSPATEVTTGPLGQGCATSVGLALAEAHMAARFNRDGHRVIDHKTWVLCSDGDLMEGVSAEAASVAAHLKLGKLTWIWDDNRITIEGRTDLTVSEDVVRRFEAYGWHTQRVDDANDLEALARAFETARTITDRPTFIAVRSHIAYGSPGKQDSASSHGSPLGEEEIRGAKRAYGWPEEARFLVPSEVEGFRERLVEQGRARAESWQQRHDAWAAAYPELASEWSRRLERRLPDGWQRQLPSFEPGEAGAKGVATRVASGKVLNAIADSLGELITGSADLGPSCKTAIGSGESVAAGRYDERNLHFGIREHAMGAMLNGMSLHGGLRPVGSTFLVFADYMRPAIRLAAIMDEPSIFVFTHDSIWVGEDGPTHQPIEHVMSLRLIPNLTVIRPADANEVAAAWRLALERTSGPTAIILCRQGVPVLEGTCERALEGVGRGGYVLAEAGSGKPRLVLLATGSEVQLATAAREALERRGTPTRVVSLPSWEAFAEQPAEYRRQVLPPDVPRIAVEAGVTHGWRELVGDHGAVLGIDRFGASAPGKVVAEKLGMTVKAVIEAATSLLAAHDA